MSATPSPEGHERLCNECVTRAHIRAWRGLRRSRLPSGRRAPTVPIQQGGCPWVVSSCSFLLVSPDLVYRSRPPSLSAQVSSGLLPMSRMARARRASDLDRSQVRPTWTAAFIPPPADRKFKRGFGGHGQGSHLLHRSPIGDDSEDSTLDGRRSVAKILHQTIADLCLACCISCSATAVS